MENSLELFVKNEQKNFELLNTGITWESSEWDCSRWLFNRSKQAKLIFKLRILLYVGPYHPSKDEVLPEPFNSFCKGLLVYLYRTKSLNFQALNGYNIIFRKLYLNLKFAGVNSVKDITRIHFEDLIIKFKSDKYKNLYDAATNLKVIADAIDKFKLTPLPLNFVHGVSPTRLSYHYPTPISAIQDETERFSEGKMPTYEAMRAYAYCTNNPINDDEEILLRTIDLLIAMGQRGNEVTHIPYDCWVERVICDKDGKTHFNPHGKALADYGIRYYAEKKFQPRVHWLAPQDVPLASRAIERLKVLTKEVRDVAEWQEKSDGKLWDVNADEEISDAQILKFLQFKNAYYLQLHLNNLKIVFIRKDETVYHEVESAARIKRYCSKVYRAGDIEKVLIGRYERLKEYFYSSVTKQPVLRLSEMLCISFEGAFRFKRESNLIKLFPRRVKLTDINWALGTVRGQESIFERRGLTEADGSKIRMTSHQPRHWRNTLYELAGMSDVQQALAMGRQRLDQNPVYQHTNLLERSASQKDFFAFNSINEKINFLHDGIRNKNITGSLTNTYHELKNKHGIDNAELFLKSHAGAMHITPYGGCTHDFSQLPCPKHLQCWNGCSHLHFTGDKKSIETLEKQIQEFKTSLSKMTEEGGDDFGSDKWIVDLTNKIANMEMALKKSKKDNTQVFPEGKPFTISQKLKSKPSV